ncbi:hypothetical protein KEG38_01145 [Polyangium jinanense]|nr:hypothetical protein [Polyangium jinanense]
MRLTGGRISFSHLRVHDFRRVAPLLPLVLVAACDRGSSDITPSPMPSAAVAASGASPAGSTTPAVAAATTTAAPIKPPEGPPACKVGEKKVWGAGANKLTGLSVVDLGEGRHGVGLAMGYDPHVLVVEKSGEGRLVKVAVGKSSPLAKPPKAEEGTRKVMRVTPSKVDGDKVYAFVDYHDEYKDKRRRVACGPADTSDAWNHFDGTPWLDRPEKPTGEERAKLLKGHDYDRGHAEDDAKAKVDEAEDEKGYHELRDCRTFSDGGGRAWIVGSELEADEKAEGALEWKSTLMVDTGNKENEVHLHEIVLKGDPPALASFEVPISRAFDDGSLLLATRFSSTLRVGILGKNKRLKSKLVSYPGFPTIPYAAEDGEDVVIVTSVAKEKGHFALRALRVPKSQELPKKLVAIDTHMGDAGHDHAHGHDDEADHHDHSETDPTFLRDTQGRRWLAFIEGKRGSGDLELVPIDEKFQAIGKRFSVLDDKALASEVRLLPLPDGKILVVSLREGTGGTELVSEELTCDIVKE